MSIFPELFDSFVSTSLIKKAIEADHISIQTIDPRQFCNDKHKQIDDDPYGGGAGLVLKAPPLIAAIKNAVETAGGGKTAIVILKPSDDVFNQAMAHRFADEYEAVIFVAGRYEGIDHRVCLWGREEFGADWYEVSIGEFVTLGGELPAMTLCEAIVRLVPGVIKEQESREKESYRPEQGGKKIEHPHYTRPAVVEGYDVPEVLLSGNHALIEQWRDDLTQ